MAVKKTVNVVSLLISFFVLINLLAYFISGESSYYFQDLLAFEHLSDKVFDEQNQLTLLFMSVILLLNMHSLMQRVQYQQYLLLILCAINIFLPIKIHFYALLSAVNSTILVLTNAWIQLFCPASLRGMVAGILTAFYGVLDIFDTYIENFRIFDEKVMHSCANVMFILMIVLFWSLKKSTLDLAQQLKPQDNIRIQELFQRYLFIFLSCILVGLNSGIFYYTYNDALMIFPNGHPETFQYMINIVSVIAPFIFGFVADRYGYMRTQMQAFYLITMVHFLNFLVEILGFRNALTLYSLSFLDCALANCISVSIVAICGQYFFKQGLFRSFALHGILYNIGNFFCDVIYGKFPTSFANYQLMVGLVNILFLIVIFRNFKQFQKQEKTI